MIDVVRGALDSLVSTCLARGYDAILEADVCAWLFHFLVTDPRVAPKDVHCDTRVAGAPGRYDLALGDVEMQRNGRPAIQAKLVAEVKLFPEMGFGDPAHRVHYEHILSDDLPKLASVARQGAVSILIVVDARGYLRGSYKGHNRREYLVTKVGEVAPGTHVLIAARDEQVWRVDHLVPGSGVTGSEQA